MLPRQASPRLKDVAEAAGVHISTVSRALNDQTASMVQAGTVLRVRLAASELGYSINGLARALKTRHSMSVGMVVPDITNPFFPPAVRGAEQALAAAGFSLLLSSTDNDIDKANAQLDAMIQARVDGMLLGMVRRQDPIIGRLNSSGIPTVLFNRTVDDGGGVCAVVPDDAGGSRLAVAHLHGLGHRRLGLVIGPMFTSTAERRLSAVRSVVQELGLECHVVEATAFDEAAGHRAMTQMLREQPRRSITAVVASNDLLALGVIDAARQAGLSCPQDISVVGFNDMPLAGRLQPPLTTVHVPARELGRLAGECLLRAMADPTAEPERTVVPVDLVVRGSTAPPP